MHQETKFTVRKSFSDFDESKDEAKLKAMKRESSFIVRQ